LWYASSIQMPLLRHTLLGYAFDIKPFMSSVIYIADIPTLQIQYFLS
jgi:hypothetical protein